MKDSIEELVIKFKDEKDYFQKAKLIEILKRENKLTTKEISEKLGMKASYICHILRLLRLPPIAIDGYYSGMVSKAHLFIIARLKTKEDMLDAYESVLANSFTSAQTEELIREKLYGLKTDNQILTKEEISAFQNNMKELYSVLKVQIIQTRVRGKLICEISGQTKHTTSQLRELMVKLSTDTSGIKKIKKDLFILE